MKAEKRKYPKPGTPGVVDFGDRRAHFVTPKFGRWRKYQMMEGVIQAAMAASNAELFATATLDLAELVARDCVTKFEAFVDPEGTSIDNVDELLEREPDTEYLLTIRKAVFAGTPLGTEQKKTSSVPSDSSTPITPPSDGTTETPTKDDSEDADEAA